MRMRNMFHSARMPVVHTCTEALGVTWSDVYNACLMTRDAERGPYRTCIHTYYTHAYLQDPFVTPWSTCVRTRLQPIYIHAEKRS